MEFLVAIVYLAVVVFIIAGCWKVFTKAGKPGWACLIPIYNIIVLLEIVGKPVWWFILLLIPIVNFIIAIILNLALAKAFGKGGGFAAGLIFLPFIFIPILGFGSAQYQGAPA
ncbi:MAG: signal peptidase I [Myxococcales bacterium]|nr:signal peptidase I [Myxococcales bacterium]